MDKIDTLKANIERIRTVKYNIADTITSKGVNTDTTEKFELFASKIKQISGSGSGGSSGGGSTDTSNRLYIVKDTQFLNPEEYVTHHISADAYMSVRSGNGVDKYCVIGDADTWSVNALFHNPTKHSLYNANKYKKLHIEFMFHGEKLYHSQGSYWDKFIIKIATQEQISSMYNNLNGNTFAATSDIMGYAYSDPEDVNSYYNIGLLKDIKKNTYYKKDIDISSLTDGMECFDIVFYEETKGCISIRNMYLY